MKRICLVLGLLILINCSTFAKHIDENTAKQVAGNFISSFSNPLNMRLDNNLETVFISSSKSVSSLSHINPTTYYYVFNVGQNGFIMVSADDNVSPILGYSSESTYEPNNVPRSVQKWFEEYKEQIRYVISNNIPATKEIKAQWDNLKTSKKNLYIANTSVDPLMSTKWNQLPYFNALCPGGSVTGCVATGMAQIMKYWDYPAKGTGFHSYNHRAYGTLSANFGSATYDWKSMPNTVSSANNAVALLMYHCGVSVDMDYSPNSSNAYVIQDMSMNPEVCAEYALKTYFGYKNTLSGKQRVNYSQNDWMNLLNSELNAKRPILYAGFGGGGGHCFVADGYDVNNYYHFNWGWGGAYDGFFQINALNPDGLGAGGGSGSYNSGHQAVIGIEPSAQSTQKHFDLKLYSNISMESNQIWFTNGFDATVNIANFGDGNFQGDIGAAIFDQNYNFVNFMDLKSNNNLEAQMYYGFTFSNAGSVAYVPGTYYLQLYYRTETQDWSVINPGQTENGSELVNLYQFNIVYAAAIETYSAFTLKSGEKLVQGDNVTINVDALNNTEVAFKGQFRLSLSNLDGTYAQSIAILSTNPTLEGGYHYPEGLDFTGEITVEPGTYLLDLDYKEDGTSIWYFAGSSLFYNPVYVIVEAAELKADKYEENNSIPTATNLPANFTSSNITVNTEGSNIHIGTDFDVYRIDLPTGFDYTITPQLFDAFNNGTSGKTYTVDALFSYSTDNGQTWSDIYDDMMEGNIKIIKSGSILFYIAPYFAGDVGTYLLDVAISRTPTTGVIELDKNDEIVKLFPNPASEFVNIDLSNSTDEFTTLSVMDVQGKQISSMELKGEKTLQLPLQKLPNGAYMIKLQADQKIIIKEIIINR